MGSFSVAGYFFDLSLDFRILFGCKNHEISKKNVLNVLLYLSRLLPHVVGIYFCSRL